jgi:hypothetical protein
MTTTGISRRALMGLTGTALATAAGVPAMAAEAPAEAVFANGVSVLSSGPATGYIAGWAKLLTPYLVHGLPHDVTASFEAMGGPDGVTVCNAFGARMDPDGSTMMVTPGAAFLAWLEGDSRVKYDAGQLIPALIGTSRLVLVGTRPLTDIVTRKRAVRLGAINPIGPELAAMLALDLLGVPVAPVFGQGDTKSLVDGLRRGRIDVALLSGAKIRDALAAALAAGAKPLMILASASSCDVPSTRDALLPEIPTFLEAAAALSRPLPNDARFSAYDAATIAASTCFAAVLSDLVRPGTVAFWRRGAQLAADSLSVAAVATQQELILQTGDCAEHLMQRMTGSPAAVVALRATLLHRFGWHAS